MKLLLVFTLSCLLLMSSAHAEQYDKNSWFVATRTGNIELITKHLEAGMDLNAIDDLTGNTPLMNAVESCNIEAIQLLIDAGAPINAVTGPSKNSYQNWPKRCALTSAFRFPEILQFLIDSGADVNIKLAQRSTPMHYAAEREDTFNALCTLIRNGADINAVDLYKRTPLHRGVYSNKIAIELLNNGANLHAVDDKGWKPLHYVYKRCDINLLKECISRGASLNEITPDGGNALHHACGRHFMPGMFDLIKFLIEDQKMNVNENGHSSSGEGGLTPLMYAIGSQANLEDDFEILDYLVEKGADFNSKFYYIYEGKKHIIKNTVLAWAKGTHQPNYVIEWMIQNGAK